VEGATLRPARKRHGRGAALYFCWLEGHGNSY